MRQDKGWIALTFNCRFAQKKYSALQLFFASFAVIALASGSPAQTTDTTAATGAGEALEEIVVSARKVTENLQRAPASIDVVSADQLVSGGIEIPTDLNKVFPSVGLRSQGPVAQTYIRGVGSSLDFPWTSAASAFTYNGIIVPRYGTKSVLFDLSRVEEIAGPQGTLYGGTAAGGAINLIGAQPDNSFSGNGLLEVGNYGDVHAAVSQNLPISDKLSSRTTIDYSRHNAYDKIGFFSSDRFAGRESLLYTPTDDLTVLVFYSGSSEKGTPPAALHSNVHPLPDNPWSSLPSAFPNGAPINGGLNYQNSRTDIVGANVEWRVGDATLTYIPGYVHVHDDYAFFLTSGILDLHDKENQSSQELRWNQKFGNFQLSAGLFWLNNRTDFLDGISVPVLPAALGYYFHVPVIDSIQQTNTNYGVFAQGVYSVTDRLRLTVGGRGSKDMISAAGIGGRGPFNIDHSQTTPDWKVGVDYDLAPQILVYANIQTSYVPFGYNPDAGNPVQVLPKSKLLSYSAGVKSRYLDNRLEINDELFYYNYSDFQAFGFDIASAHSIVANAKKSRIYGDELSVRWIITEATKLDSSIVYQNATYTDFTGPGFDYSGFQMANAPRINAVVGLQHEIGLGKHGSLLGRVQTQYSSGVWENFAHEGTLQTAYSKTDLSATYALPDGRWKVQAFINNVGNEATFTGLGPTKAGQPGVGFLDAPRTYGLRLIASWR